MLKNTKICVEDGKELYYWKDEETEEDFAEEIKVDNIVKFINEYYDKNDYKGNYVPSVEECHYCEVCADELDRRDMMFIVYDEKYIYDKTYSLVYEDDTIVEEPMIQTDLTGFWVNTPKFYKLVNRTYNNIEANL